MKTQPLLPAIIAALVLQCAVPSFADSPTALYHEKHRPQFHITARQWEGDNPQVGRRDDGWINDVNGPVYFAGEYHLFAQRWHYAWLHFVSKDLVHWEELPPAFKEEKGAGELSICQSGTCVIDKENCSGLATEKDQPVMIAFWTGANVQCISYSNDKGRTWMKYAKNPVLRHASRDPKVFWHEPTKSWAMLLCDDTAARGKGLPAEVWTSKSVYQIFTSKNLLDWTKQPQPIPNSFECPDMLHLPVDGDKARMKWVVVRGNGSGLIGEFTGTEFKTEAEADNNHRGFYAAQSFYNEAEADDRCVHIGWIRGGVYPNMPFDQQLTFPCELSLKTVNGKIQVFRRPAAEIEKLHTRKVDHKFDGAVLSSGDNLPLPHQGESLHLKMVLEFEDRPIYKDGPDPHGVIQGGEGVAIIHIRGERLEVRSRSLHGVAVKSVPPLPEKGSPSTSIITLDLLIDRTSIEAFANGGEASLTKAFLPIDDNLSLQCFRGPVRIRSLEIYEMGSIWEK